MFDWGTARTGVRTATGALALNTRYLVNVGADGEATYLAVANVETKTALKSYTAVCEGELKVEHVTVFGASLTVGFRYAPMRLYSLTIYEGAELKRDFVPCVSATEGAGLWDLVEGKFYPNKGGGSFNTP